jgi:hypothetical protein
MLDLLIVLIEPVHILLSGGTLEQARETEGAFLLIGGALALVPASIIGLSIGLMNWRETPLARLLAFKPAEEDRSWMDRAGDLDGDGRPDI